MTIRPGPDRPSAARDRAVRALKAILLPVAAWAVLFIAASPPAQAQSLTVVEIFERGQPVRAAGAIVLRDADGAPRPVSVAIGLALDPELTVEVPAATELTLSSADGNRLRLGPGTRLRLQRQRAGASTVDLLRGLIAVQVREALDFFGISHEQIVASVRGTEFTVETDGTGGLTVVVGEGRVEVERPLAVSVGGDAGRPGLRIAGLRQARMLDAGGQGRFDARGETPGMTFAGYEEAERHFRDVLRRAEAAGDPVGRWRALDNLMAVLYRLGQPGQVLALDAACRTAGEASGRPDAPVRCLNHRGAARVGRGQYAAAIEDFDLALAAMRDGAVPDAQALSASIRANRAVALAGLGRAGAAEDDLRVAIAALRALAGAGPDPALANALDTLGTTLLAQGRTQEAGVALQDALAMRERLHGGGGHADIAQSLGNLAGARLAQGRAAEAADLAGRALAIWQRLHPRLDHPDIVIVLVRLGLIEESSGRTDDAVAFQRRALAMVERLGDRAAPTARAAPLLALARIESAAGDTAGAAARADQALASLLAHLPGEHPDVGAARMTAAAIHYRAGRYERAAALYGELIEAAGEPGHPAAVARLADLWSNLGVSLRAAGDAARAVAAHERALSLRLRDPGSGGRLPVVRSRINLARARLDLGRHDAAAETLSPALASLAASSGAADSADSAIALTVMSMIDAARGRPQAALQSNGRAIEIRERLAGGRPDPALADGLARQGRLLAAQGHAAQALHWLDRALAMMADVHPQAGHPEWRQALLDRADVLEALGRADEARGARQRAARMDGPR